LEVAIDTAKEALGTDAVTVSGHVVAATQAGAQALYTANVRTAYNTSLVQSERTSYSNVTGNADATGAQPAASTQFVRMDFNFSVFQAKGSTTVNYRYGMSVSNDWLQLEQRTQIRGSIFAVSSAAASAAQTALVNGLVPAGAALVRSDSGQDYEYTSASGVTAFLKYDFTVEYVGRITGQAGLLEMKLTESVTYSGTRWIEHPLPRYGDGTGGVSIVQDGGQTCGKREVRGSVSAPTLAAAQNWAWQQQSLLTGDNSDNNYPTPPQLDNEFEFIPRFDGVAYGATANVKVYRVSFSLGELLPNYLPPG